MLKNWRTKVSGTITAGMALFSLFSDGVQGDDLNKAGIILGALATLWFLRDAVQK